MDTNAHHKPVQYKNNELNRGSCIENPTGFENATGDTAPASLGNTANATFVVNSRWRHRRASGGHDTMTVWFNEN